MAGHEVFATGFCHTLMPAEMPLSMMAGHIPPRHFREGRMHCRFLILLYNKMPPPGFSVITVFVMLSFAPFSLSHDSASFDLYVRFYHIVSWIAHRYWYHRLLHVTRLLSCNCISFFLPPMHYRHANTEWPVMARYAGCYRSNVTVGINMVTATIPRYGLYRWQYCHHIILPVSHTTVTSPNTSSFPFLTRSLRQLLEYHNITPSSPLHRSFPLFSGLPEYIACCREAQGHRPTTQTKHILANRCYAEEVIGAAHSHTHPHHIAFISSRMISQRNDTYRSPSYNTAHTLFHNTNKYRQYCTGFQHTFRMNQKAVSILQYSPCSEYKIPGIVISIASWSAIHNATAIMHITSSARHRQQALQPAQSPPHQWGQSHQSPLGILANRQKNTVINSIPSTIPFTNNNVIIIVNGNALPSIPTGMFSTAQWIFVCMLWVMVIIATYHHTFTVHHVTYFNISVRYRLVASPLHHTIRIRISMFPYNNNCITLSFSTRLSVITSLLTNENTIISRILHHQATPSIS